MPLSGEELTLLARHGRRRRAFSVLELLVAIGIVGLLLGMILPAIQRARESASRMSCLSNLRQVGVALHNFHNTHGRLPPVPLRGGTNNPQSWLTWRVMILPEIEQDELWATTQTACSTEPNLWRNPPHTGSGIVIKLYVCPSDSRLLQLLPEPQGNMVGYSSYIGVIDALGMSGPGVRLADIRDGTSNTLMVGERPPPSSLESGRWYAMRWTPDQGLTIPGLGYPWERCVWPFYYGPGRLDNRCDQHHFWSLHQGGANFLAADGSGHFLSYSTDRSIMKALATRAGGEAAQLPD
jgi:type II secretory pathway pseudopilin PulG